MGDGRLSVIKVLRETHEAPRFAQEALRLAGGLNRFGKPNYRVVWGWNRLDWTSGQWEPKYNEVNRWHIERWVSPEIYGTPRSWKDQTRGVLGPYPNLGDYEPSLCIDEPCELCQLTGKAKICDHRQFVQLTPTILYGIARRIEMSRGFTEQERTEAIRRHLQNEQRAEEKNVDEVLGADPAPISPERRRYVEEVIAPQLGTAMTRSQHRPAGSRAPKASAGLPT